MDVIVTVDQRYDCTPDGKIWTSDQYAYSFFTRYLEVFEHVKVMARVRSTASVPENYLPVMGEQVTVIPLPHYHGMGQFLKQRQRVRHAILNALTFENAIIFRVASINAHIAIPILSRQRFPYGTEVISDPHNTFGPRTSRHPLRLFVRWWFEQSLRQECANAAGASYVTREYLQRVYPCPQYSVSISDVEIDDQALVSNPRTAPEPGQTIRLVFVGSLDQLYKAPDILVEAFKLCVQDGLDLHLTMVGDGHYRTEIEKQISDLGLKHQVQFVGKLSGAERVRAELDRADLFILPSRAEGLPRALIEAMARGLPCISTLVGGIPELLPADDLVPPDDAPALAQKIKEFVLNPVRMTTASRRNLEVAREYHTHILSEQRRRFYQHIFERTAAWMSHNDPESRA